MKEINKMKQISAVFLDRDGVVNVEKNYLHKVEDFEFLPDVIDAVRRYNEKGYVVVVVTNQSGIARGYYGEEEYQKLTEHMLSLFEKYGAKIAAVYHCPHHESDGCDCRKPLPGMLLRAKEELGIDMASSWMIGDKESDVQAAKAAGVGHALLVRTGHEIDEAASCADKIVNGIFDTIDLINSRK